ncbi:NAD-dependent epimerase/dehydratase family protein [Streptomyces celluloflavus]|uniref:NAD-dependent epimerase/dehydratase family protein n=1 Tax=Streptomyces celluloflavus TaxID=58344 RepID=UPI0036686E10
MGVEITGRGFLASHMERLRPRHPHALLLAAGVSSTVADAAHDFDREAELCYEMVRRCRAAGRTLVFLSTASAAMYGGPDGDGREDGPVFPPSPYGRHKLALETVVRSSGVQHLVLRLGHVVGPRQRGHQFVPALVRALRSGSVLVHKGATRDLIAVEDVVTLTDRLLGLGVADETVNVVSGRTTSVENILDHMERRLGLRAGRTEVDGPLAGCHPSAAKLRRLVPNLHDLGFDENYFRRAIDSYLQS